MTAGAGSPPAAWGWTLAEDLEAGRHWLPRAWSVAADAEAGHRFRGRHAALRAILDHVTATAAPDTALVVTGAPGAGKSAVLGRVVTTADPGIAAALPPEDDAPRAPLGAIACAVHAKGKTALEIAREIARAASAEPPARIDDLVDALAEAPAGDDRIFAVVLDALDEAASPAEARAVAEMVVLPLVEHAEELRVRVVVGTRRRDDDGDLIDAFAISATVLDLDDPAYFAPADLAAYALASLRAAGGERSDGPYRDESAARPVAERIAALAGANFLIAGLVARSHALFDTSPADPDAIAFAPTVEAALAGYLVRIPGVGGFGARDLLAALGYARGAGLPLSLWHAAVIALHGDAPSRPELRAFAASAAANFLVETGGSGPETAGAEPGEPAEAEPGEPAEAEPAYRLYHQALGEVLRGMRPDVTADERAVAHSLAARGRAIGWAHAPGYLLRELFRHARAGGGIDELLADDDYLLHADLRGLIPAAGSARTPLGRRRARLLRQTPRAVEAAPDARAALFGVTEAQEGLGNAFRDIDRPLPYRAVWANLAPREEEAVFDGDGRPSTLCAVELADGRNLLLTGGEAAYLWDPATGERLHALVVPIEHVHAACQVDLRDGGPHVVTGDTEGRVWFWDPATGAPRHLVDTELWSVESLCALPGADGRTLLASGDSHGTIRLYDADSREPVRSLAGHALGVSALCAVELADGRTALASAGDHRVLLWDTATGTQLREFGGHASYVSGLCQVRLPDGATRLASADGSGSVRLYDPGTGVVTVLAAANGKPAAVCALAVEAGHEVLAIARRGAIDLVDPATGERLRELGHDGSADRLCPVRVPDGRTLLATTGSDGTLRLWDPAADADVRARAQRVRSVRDVAVARQPDGRALIVSGGGDGLVRLWDAATGEHQRDLRGHEGWVTSVCALPAPDGSTLIGSADSGGTLFGGASIRLWDACTGAARHVPRGDDGWGAVIGAAPLAAGGTLLAVGGSDGAVRLWDPVTGAATAPLRGHAAAVSALCPVRLPDGAVLLATAGGGTVRLWDVAEGTAVASLSIDCSWVNDLCTVPASGGGVLLATADPRGTVSLWDVARLGPGTGEPAGEVGSAEGGAAAVGRFTVPTGAADAMCALPLPDGRALLATGGVADRAVRLWDPDTLRQVREIPVRHPVHALAEVDGRLLVALGGGLMLLAVSPPEPRDG